MKSYSLFLLVLFAESAFGDLSVTSRPAKAVTGLSNPEVVANVILVGDDSVPVVSQVAVIKVDTKAKFLRLKARTDLFNSTALKPISERTDANTGIVSREYLLSGIGRYSVEAMTFDSESGIEEQTIEVIVGPSKPPTPPSPPPTPVPSDPFDNIGQRVANWSNGCPKRSEVSVLYRNASISLRNDPSTTIDSVSAKIASERTKLLGSDALIYSKIVESLNSDLKSRWSSISNRGTYADYLAAIAVGFEVKQ